MRANRVPGRELVHGVMILVAGVLLLTPGFVTDSLGFLLFVPGIRDLVWRFAKDRVVVQTMSSGFGNTTRPGEPGRDGIVDLDEDEFQRNPDASSPWSEDSDRLSRPGKRGGDGSNGL